MNASTALALQDVSVGYPTGRRFGSDKFFALRHLTMTLEHGEKLGVVGRNGAGKSTLLRLMAGTVAPDSGEVERNHGLCQLLTLGPGFVPYLSGRDNAILSALIQGMPRREIEDALGTIRDFSELGDFFERPINTYSSGMKARLGFSVALQLRPDILLLDEILGVGDPAFREKSRRALRERLRSDATVVLVSHDEDTIRKFCNRVVWIEHGEQVMHDETERVLERYAAAA